MTEGLQQEVEKQLTPLEQIEKQKQDVIFLYEFSKIIKKAYQRAIDEKTKISSLIDYLSKQKEQTKQFQQTQKELEKTEKNEQKFAKSYSFNTVLERKPFVPLVHKKDFFEHTNNVFINSDVKFFEKDQLITPNRVFEPNSYKKNIYTKAPGVMPEIPEYKLSEKEKLYQVQFQQKLQEELDNVWPLIYQFQQKTIFNKLTGKDKRKVIEETLEGNKVFLPVPTKLDYFTKTPQFLE